MCEGLLLLRRSSQVEVSVIERPAASESVDSMDTRRDRQDKLLLFIAKESPQVHCISFSSARNVSVGFGLSGCRMPRAHNFGAGLPECDRASETVSSMLKIPYARNVRDRRKRRSSLPHVETPNS